MSPFVFPLEKSIFSPARCSQGGSAVGAPLLISTPRGHPPGWPRHEMGTQGVTWARREGGIHPAAGSKWRAQRTAGLLSARDVGICARAAKDVSEKRQQSVVAAECASARFVDGQCWWSWWLQEARVKHPAWVGTVCLW